MLELDKEKQLAEMAVKCCTRNPQARTVEECFDCEFKNGMCNTYRLAETLYNEGYCKASDVANEFFEVLKNTLDDIPWSVIELIRKYKEEA